MPHIRHVVEMRDGTRHRVAIDQRDFAAMEAMEFPLTARVTQNRYMVWNALKRENGLQLTWPAFNEVEALAVDTDDLADEDQADESADDGGGEGEQRLNPGRRGRSAAGDSTLRSRPANRSTGPQAS